VNSNREIFVDFPRPVKGPKNAGEILVDRGFSDDQEDRREAPTAALREARRLPDAVRAQSSAVGAVQLSPARKGWVNPARSTFRYVARIASGVDAVRARRCFLPYVAATFRWANRRCSGFVGRGFSHDKKDRREALTAASRESRRLPDAVRARRCLCFVFELLRAKRERCVRRSFYRPHARSGYNPPRFPDSPKQEDHGGS